MRARSVDPANVRGEQVTYAFKSVKGLRYSIARAESVMSRLSPGQRGQLALCIVQLKEELNRREP